MDNFKTLFERKEYQTIIDLTKDAHDVNALLYRLNSFISLNKYEEAIELFNNYRDRKTLFLHDPVHTLDLHMSLLMRLGRYADALTDIKIYENYDYVSQQVEEMLREYPKRIVNELTKSEKKRQTYSLENISKSFIESEDDEEILNFIYYLKKLDITPYLESLIALLKRTDIKDDTKTFALLLLVAKEIDKMVIINKNKATTLVNPKKLVAPFTGNEYQSVINLIENIAKDPSISDVAINLFNQIIMIIYPDNPYKNRAINLALTFITLAKKYLQSDDLDTSFIKINKGDEATINELIKEYQTRLNK